MASTITEKANTAHLANRNISSAVKNGSTCTRCDGLMVIDFSMDLLDRVDESIFPPKRCVQCGQVVDFVILFNRQRGQQPMPIQHARETFSNDRMTKGH